MSNLVLVQPRADGEGRLALDILRKELQARTGLCPSVAPEAPDGAFVAVGTEGELDAWQDALRALPTPGPEGYRLCVLSREPLQAVVCGADARGCLYGCGTPEELAGATRLARTPAEAADAILELAGRA